jgi:hypothetical protein
VTVYTPNAVVKIDNIHHEVTIETPEEQLSLEESARDDKSNESVESHDESSEDDGVSKI